MITAVYAFSHFAVDLGCAFVMFRLFGDPWSFLLYNFFAFAAQMPLGLLADAVGRNRLFAVLGAALVGLCLLLPACDVVSVCLLGLGNALFHIGGGLEILHRCDKAAPLGIFVSPGALGVWLGTVLGKNALRPMPVAALLLLACSMMLLCRKAHAFSAPVVRLPGRNVLLPAALLFAVVVLRSLGGAAALPWKSGAFAFAAVCAVMLGKALGGILSDRFGAGSVCLYSLIGAGVFFLFGTYAIAGLAALLFFNMTMPVTLHALGRYMPGAKGFSFGLLTFALFLGFLPSYFGAPPVGSIVMCILCLVSAALLLWGMKAGDRL